MVPFLFFEFNSEIGLTYCSSISVFILSNSELVEANIDSNFS